MNILSVDWAFHNTGFCYYDHDKKIIYLWTMKIEKKKKIELWNTSFYYWYKQELRKNIFKFKMLNGYLHLRNDYVVEIGFGKADKMSLFYAWFYNMWLDDKLCNVEFINSKDWITKTLNVDNANKLKDRDDKLELANLFYERFKDMKLDKNITQDEKDATMMLLHKYPTLKIKKIVKWELK